MKNFSKELSFKTSRSSGAGGQNVNKVETAVTVLWKVDASEFFNEDEKALIQNKLKNRINAEGYLFLTVSESRTQLMNKNKAIEKIIEIVNKALIIPKKRTATILIVGILLIKRLLLSLYEMFLISTNIGLKNGMQRLHLRKLL